MYRTLLLVVDDRGVGSGALVAFAALACRWDARVQVLHLHVEGEAGRTGACRRLEVDVVARLTAAGVPAAGETRPEEPAGVAVARAAAGCGADLVAILGDRGAPAGVGYPRLVVPEPPRRRARPAWPARVLLAVPGEACLDAAARALESGGGEAVAVHVLGPGEPPERGQELVAAAAWGLRRRAVRGRGLLLSIAGSPAAQIAAAADRLDAALVVVAAGPLGEELAAGTGRPLLLTP